jgi:hypothetical protein
MLFDYFKSASSSTVTGGRIGCEIETDFLDMTTGAPISRETNNAIIESNGLPKKCVLMRELGVQKIELAVGPCRTFDELLQRAHDGLNHLYKVADQYNARPVFTPEIHWDGSLLYATEDRDKLWVELDGSKSLEQLCRCSSVQFTVDVNPADAIDMINALWAAKIQERDYAPNNRRVQNYIKQSHAHYRTDRYGGPSHFKDLEDYVRKLAQHDVVMHKGQTVRLKPNKVPDLDIGLFIRSVWWHYRLRRYNDNLGIEIRPFSRRDDDCLETYWKESIAPVFGF